jgi:hypothetical protein
MAISCGLPDCLDLRAFTYCVARRVAVWATSFVCSWLEGFPPRHGSYISQILNHHDRALVDFEEGQLRRPRLLTRQLLFPTPPEVVFGLSQRSRFPRINSCAQGQAVEGGRESPLSLQLKGWDPVLSVGLSDRLFGLFSCKRCTFVP